MGGGIGVEVSAGIGVDVWVTLAGGDGNGEGSGVRILGVFPFWGCDATRDGEDPTFTVLSGLLSSFNLDGLGELGSPAAALGGFRSKEFSPSDVVRGGKTVDTIAS